MYSRYPRLGLWMVVLPTTIGACSSEEAPDNREINMVSLDLQGTERNAFVQLWDHQPPAAGELVLPAGAGFAANISLQGADLPMGDGVPTDVVNLTAAVEDAPDVFLIVFEGSALGGDDPLLMHQYQDSESLFAEKTGEDLPVGIYNTLRTTRPGQGTLRVALVGFPESKTGADVDEVLAAGPSPEAIVAAGEISVTVE